MTPVQSTTNTAHAAKFQMEATATASTSDAVKAAQAQSAQAILAVLEHGGPVDISMVMNLLSNRTADLDAQIRAHFDTIQSTAAGSAKFNEQIQALNKLAAAIAAASTGNRDGAVDLTTLKVDGIPALEFIEKHQLVEFLPKITKAPPPAADVRVAASNYFIARSKLMQGPNESAAKLAKSIEAQYPEFATFSDKDLARLGTKGFQVAAEELQKPTLEMKTKLSSTELDHVIENVRLEQSSLNQNNEVLMIRLQSALQARAQVISLVSNMIRSIQETEKSVVANVR